MEGVIVLTMMMTSLMTSSLADISGTNPPYGSCLCVTATSLNMRDAPCGTAVGSAPNGACYIYQGSRVTCTLTGTSHDFFEVDFGDGQNLWGAGTFFIVGPESSCGVNPDEPDVEFRGSFVTSVYNIDWPTSSSLSSAAAQQELTEVVSGHMYNRFNAMMFQVRPAGDALYSSSLEPWSKYLTGNQGQAPSPLWDPLSHAVTEAHASNIEVHVWLNPYRANLAASTSGLAANHMCITMSQYCYSYGNYMWMDPGAQPVVDHLISIIEDILTRYDVDGIHFDDYFYPYPVSGVDFPDSATYQDYLNGGGSLGRDDWRRDNVNSMVQVVRATIKALRPEVQFSISPFGIYRPGNPEGMPPPIAGLDPYTAMFADSKLWLQQGWVDFLAPQLYWSIASTGQSYPTLLDWWLDNNPANKYIYAANGLYKMEDSNDWPASEIVNQLEISRDALRRSKMSFGNIMYSWKFIRDDYKSLAATLRSSVYTKIATPPGLPSLDVPEPLQPINVVVDGYIITWDRAVADAGTHVWCLYREVGGKWELISIVKAENTRYEALNAGRYAIRGKNRANVLGKTMDVFVA